MFDSKHIEAYNQIKAPDELKSRILAQETKNTHKTIHVDFKRVALAAACFAVLLTAVLGMSTNGRSGITVNGETVKNNATVYIDNNNARSLVSVAEASLEVTLEHDKAATWFAHSGELLIIGADGGIVHIDTGATCHTDGAQRVVWTLNTPDTQSVYTLTVQTKKGTRTLSLQYDEEQGWFVENTEALMSIK